MQTKHYQSPAFKQESPSEVRILLKAMLMLTKKLFMF